VAVSHHFALRSPDFPRYFRNAVIRATLQLDNNTGEIALDIPIILLKLGGRIGLTLFSARLAEEK
jgi:hypothetical protein